ncbi:MAG: CehA/McbA family metallohydrolase [Acidobacteria bacterium]|nr:CehA/McbA family metallohydrolase [Acidobacteriota bacterium]
MHSSKPNLLYALALTPICLLAQGKPSLAEYHIYTGNTHSHTLYTWSHGVQWVNNGCRGILNYGPNAASTKLDLWSEGYVKTGNAKPCIYVINGYQYPSPNITLKPDWQKYQGTPSQHYRLAKANGYDFYATTDHSQEAGLQPDSPTPQWSITRRDAAEATNGNFVAVAGFEFSENNGPGGTGHINVLNSEGILNALMPGIDLPYFYKWLTTAKPTAAGPVVASFNHPGAHQYNDWADANPAVTDIITMLEIINSNNKIHYAAFVNALDKGWKVSPICGNDNHGLEGITKQTSRTFVLARRKTRADILEAMKARRTYASLDKNIQCRYTVNGASMGSTLKRPAEFKFDIAISDPDDGSPNDRITKIDIVKDGGIVVKEHTPAPGYSIRWTPTISDSAARYFFVRVWNAGGGDAPGADPAKPVAWLAPVWTGR